MHWMTPDYSLESGEGVFRSCCRCIAKKENAGFGIFRGENLIGSIGFVHFDWKTRRRRSILLVKDEEGKGIVSAASRVLIDYAF